MTTKDYVYLALIAFSAIVFYLHGYYAALDKHAARKPRARRPRSASPLSQPTVSVTAVDAGTFQAEQNLRLSRARTGAPTTKIHCFFGNN